MIKLQIRVLALPSTDYFYTDLKSAKNIGMHYLNIDTWNRKEQFFYFKEFDNPFFNICTEVEIDTFLSFVKSKGYSFSLACLFTSLKAANETEPMRYRLEGDRVVVYDRIDAGNTILNEDKTFNFCYFKYHVDFDTFYQEGQKVLEEQQQNQQKLKPRNENKNLIHCSTLPWYRFTSFSHACNFDTDNSVPKFVFGKYFDDNGMKLPFSIEVHHALMDGIHVGHFLERFQSLLKNPAQTLET